MANRRNSRRPQKVRSAGSSDPIEPIFSGKVSNIIPGELIIQLSEDMAGKVTSSIPQGPARGLREFGARTFGVDTLDDMLKEIGVTSVSRLHPAAPMASRAMAEAVPMAGTFRLNYSSKMDAEAAAKKMAGLKGVEYAEPNVYRETFAVPNDPEFTTQWGLTRINCPAAWDRTTGSASITVAVIDTGIDLDHPELAPLLVPGQDLVNLGPSPTPPPGFRFEGDFNGVDNVPQDEVGHGTHVAGTIACLSNNGTGVAGVTWSCRLMPVKVLTRIVRISDGQVRGTGSSADVAAGIRWAVDNGARVLNLSLGSDTDTMVERDAIAYAVANNVVVVAAMGNAGPAAGASFPAAYPDVIAVGAINQADTLTAFSQIGPHIDVVAPGDNIRSTVWDNGFATMRGTSMASPHVAGVAALILSCNSGLTAAQVGDIIRQTAQAMRVNPGDPVPNDQFGFGCVDAAAALNRACPPRVSVPIIRCPSIIQVSCPSVAVICASVSVACPSTSIRCQSLSFSCRSVITVCPTLSVRCQPSLVTICRSITTICPSLPIRCRSEIDLCPTRVPALCEPIQSNPIGCGSGPFCGGPPIGRPPIERPFEQGGDEDWSDYDPYSAWNGE